MEFGTLLALHSALRWVVLLLIILVLIKSYKGLKRPKTFSTFDLRLRHITPIVAWVQLIIGSLLYSKSAIVTYFFQNLPDTLQQREIRFFGLEHSTAMPLAIILITIGMYKSKSQTEHLQKAYKVWYRWTLFAFILIITSIPWSFWPLVSRPLLRGF